MDNESVRFSSAVAILLAAMVASKQAAAKSGKVTLCPAETYEVGDGRRMLLRFDLSRLKADEVSGVTLHLTGEQLKRSVEVRPVITRWGALSEAFQQREAGQEGIA